MAGSFAYRHPSLSLLLTHSRSLSRRARSSIFFLFFLFFLFCLFSARFFLLSLTISAAYKVEALVFVFLEYSVWLKTGLCLSLSLFSPSFIPIVYSTWFTFDPRKTWHVDCSVGLKAFQHYRGGGSAAFLYVHMCQGKNGTQTRMKNKKREHFRWLIVWSRKTFHGTTRFRSLNRDDRARARGIL